MNTPLPTKINYNVIADAIDFYQQRDFEYIEVPWLVSEATMRATAPREARLYETFQGAMVASAEQSFLEMIMNNQLKPGKYVTCSPCFRDDEVDETHFNWFMKVELIDYRGMSKIQPSECETSVDDMTQHGEAFYRRYLAIEREETDIGLDLVCEQSQLELGSYGARNHNGHLWIYGTGVAEPRLSIALNALPKSYHENVFPRGVFGQLSKIQEEVDELRDAEGQGNPILALVELSDLLGAIEGYVAQHHPNVTLGDLKRMSDLTQRAFTSGARKPR